MELKVKIELKYVEIYCYNCGESLYKQGTLNPMNDNSYDEYTQDIEIQCDSCGCDDMWKVAMQFEIKK